MIFSGGVKPSAYILAAYGGQFGPNVDLTITQDEEEFKTKLDTLYASGADEVVFQALQVSWYSSSIYSMGIFHHIFLVLHGRKFYFILYFIYWHWFEKAVNITDHSISDCNLV